MSDHHPVAPSAWWDLDVAKPWNSDALSAPVTWRAGYHGQTCLETSFHGGFSSQGLPETWENLMIPLNGTIMRLCPLSSLNKTRMRQESSYSDGLYSNSQTENQDRDPKKDSSRPCFIDKLLTKFLHWHKVIRNNPRNRCCFPGLLGNLFLAVYIFPTVVGG